MEGCKIREIRETLGWSRRKLGSKLGLTLREVYALENDKDPKPRRENRIYGSKFIPFLGYSVKTYTDWPVRDTKWGLLQQQTRAIRFLDSMAAK